MKKTTLSIAMVAALALGASAAQASTITWIDSPGTSPTFGDLITNRTNNPGPGVPFSDAFAVSSEFRMVSPFNAIGGGGTKDTIFGGETWTFAGDSSTGGHSMTGVGGGLPLNSGAANSPVAPTAGTNEALLQAAPFFGPNFTFLAPTTTNLAGAAYGAGVMSFDSTDNFTIFFNTLEAQWGGTYFPLGSVGTDGDGLGITFECIGAISGNVHCQAEELIDAAEDPGAAGFAQWTAQWDMYGTLNPVHPVPVPAAVWLFGSGLVGLVGVARRKKA